MNGGPLSRSELGRADRTDPQRHPRPHRRARRRRPRLRGASRAARHAGPAIAGRRDSTRDGAVVLALEIAVDSLAAAVVGLGGEVFDLRARRSARRPHHRRRDRRRPGRPGRTRSRRAGRRPSDSIGVGVAVVGVVRRSDGFVSMAPNLGWRDVPLGPALRRRTRHPACRSPSPTTPTSARSPSSAAVRPRAATTSCSSPARSASAAASSSTAGR